jgi:hypothetical protein
VTEREQQITSWWHALCAELDVDPSTATPDQVLDLAAVAAHEVLRPAAPLTTFLVGYAAGRAGGSAEDVATAASRAADLARSTEEDA